MKSLLRNIVTLMIIFICVISVNVYGYTDMPDSLILINKNHKLDEGYVPGDLKSISQTVRSTKADIALRAEAADAFISMYNQMTWEGMSSLKAVSGYRSFSSQDIIFNNKISYYLRDGFGYDRAHILTNRYVALAGESEHQTGLAIDVSTTNTLTESFADTREGRWIAENAHNYGFVVRYNAGKEAITGIAYEPWHLRYVGLPHSQVMYEKNLCLEEYVRGMIIASRNAAAESEKVEEVVTPPVPQKVKSTIDMDEYMRRIGEKINQLVVSTADGLGYLAGQMGQSINELGQLVSGLIIQTDEADFHSLITLLWGVNIFFAFLLIGIILRRATKH